MSSGSPAPTDRDHTVTSSASFTTEFREEINFEQDRWLRRRFLWYSGVIICLGVLQVLGVFVVEMIGLNPDKTTTGAVTRWIANGLNLVAVVAYLLAFVTVYREPRPRAHIVRLVYWLIILNGVFSIIAVPITVEVRGTDSVIAEVTKRKSKDQSGETTISLGPTAGVHIDLDDDVPPNPAEPPVEAVPPPPPATESVATPESIAEAPTVQDAVTAGDSDPDRIIFAGMTKQKLVITAMVAASGLASIFITHLFACLFLPLTPWESFRPLIPLLIINGAITLYYSGVSIIPLLAVIATPLVGLPGAGICWWRHSRFRDRFTTKLVKSRYTELKQELTSARQIHESLFPRPILEGLIRLDYRYEPMRQIGGDYLYARSSADSLTIVIIDVTGHGISAALAVNRLHGEIDRQFGENPDVGPGEILDGMNAYLHYALATHSVYATALCIRVDTRANSLRWASAGHPPAFIRAVDGTIDRLESTTLVLGACRGDDFQPAERSIPFGLGDVLIAYTDGATEARNQQGKMLSVAGFERLVACVQPHTCSKTGDWCAGVLQMVDTYRFGPVQDDTLIVEISRPI